MMFYIGSRSRLKEQFRSEIIKEIDDRKPLSIKDLEFAFVGLDGRKYYHFKDMNNLPLDRFAYRKTILAWMDLGLNKKEITDLIATGREALYTGLKGNSKASSDIGFIFNEMEYRGDMVLHTELLYQFIAVHYVREDESPDGLDATIQMQKVESFKKEVSEKGSSFFLTMPELKFLYKLTEMSESEWTTFWHESLVKQQAIKAQLSVIRKGLQKK